MILTSYSVQAFNEREEMSKIIQPTECNTFTYLEYNAVLMFGIDFNSSAVLGHNFKLESTHLELSGSYAGKLYKNGLFPGLTQLHFIYRNIS